MARINLLLGASGSGKTTLGLRLEQELGVSKLVSHTTRKKRIDEIEDISYYFTTKEKFQEIELIEQTKYDGHFYGVSKQELESKLKTSGEYYATLNIEGVLAIKELYPELTRVIYIEITYEALKERMEKRGDDPQLIKTRLETVKRYNECENHRYADVVINNEGALEDAWEELKRLFEEQ